MILIVDVSEFQGTVAWGQVKASGVAGAIPKATQYRIDRQHATNHGGIPNAGLPHGCYHFLCWDQPGGPQASFYLGAAGDFGPGTFPPVLDFERYQGQLPTSQHVDDFLHEIEQTTSRRVLVYGNRGDLAQLGSLFIGRVDVWLADYGPNNGQPNGDPAHVRASTQFPASDVKLWQYTSVGKVAGIAGPCDVSMWLGSQAELDAYVNPQSQVHIQSVPQPQPAPPVHYQEDNVTKIPVHIPALDDQGNGNFMVPGVAGRVVSVKMNGSDAGGYVPPPRWDSFAIGPDEKVKLYGGTPHGVLDLTVWVVG